MNIEVNSKFHFLYNQDELNKYRGYRWVKIINIQK